MTVKQFIDQNDFAHHNWDNVPDGFPHIDKMDLGGLSSPDVGKLSALVMMWRLEQMPETPKKVSTLAPHGGYKTLKSFQGSEIVFDFTFAFCEKYMTHRTNKSPRTYDQMFQAARSGKQNIAEGSMASGTSKKTELFLVNVARASLEELLVDYEDFLREKGLKQWEKDDLRVQAIRSLAYMTNRSYKSYMSYLEKPESAANCAICLIKQTTYLLDQQKRALASDLRAHGGRI